jgi:alanine-glyoxylate transaminase / (R)-3-amino-2-methylpropionate-pyruvate transaminase
MRFNKILKNVIYNRNKYLSPSLKTFQAFKDPFVIERGNMQYVYDNKENKYLDLVGQNLCISVGHCNNTVVEKATNQMKKLAHCTTMYYNEMPSFLAKKLTETLPSHPSGDDWVVHLVNDGSEAVDLAVQMAKQYTGNQKMYALYKGYHGLQGYAAGLTAIGKATQNCYEGMFPSITHVQSNKLEELDNSLKYNTAGNVAGIIIEPLQGYGGIYDLDNGYMKSAFELIKHNNGVTIADEVQTGFCRTGESFWGFQMKNNDVIPDMITCAKGMGNGVGILGAVICRRSIAEAFTDKMFFNTYGANPVASAASLGVLEVIEKNNILENCNTMGKLFNTKINELCIKYPNYYKEVRGQGLFQGLEIYGKTNEDSIENSIKLHENTLKHGILIGRGSAAGNVFRIQPPMCIEKHDVEYTIDVLEEIALEQIQNNK